MEINYLPKYKYLEKIYKNREIYHPTKDEKTCPESHLLKIKNIISENKYLENEYNKNKEFYDNQLNYSL